VWRTASARGAGKVISGTGFLHLPGTEESGAASDTGEASARTSNSVISGPNRRWQLIRQSASIHSLAFLAGKGKLN
jgi:hypothetical protein